MKRLLLFSVLLSSFLGMGQVGIGTTSPTATLDVDGNVRIRTITSLTRETAIKDSIMVADKKGNLYVVSSKSVVLSHFKTFIKGSFTGVSDQSLTLSSGSSKLLFDYKEFDENNEYNTTTGVYTAKQDGIYAVNVQIKASGGISVATNFGVAILKNNVIAAKEGFANVGITVLFVVVNVTPPLREVETLLKLNAGDTVSFTTYSDLATVGIVGAKEESFFTIQQVR